MSRPPESVTASSTRLDPYEAMRRRVLGGSALLGLGIGVAALIAGWIVGDHSSDLPLAIFGVGCAMALAALHAGVPTHALRVFSMALLSAFVVVTALERSVIDWQQLKWLLLLPIVAVYLWDTYPAPASERRAMAPLWLGSALAVTLLVLVVLANGAGVTGGYPAPAAGEDETIIGLVDTVLLVLSVAGLVSLYQHSHRRAEEEARLLRSLLSVCAWCRRVRDDDEEWVTAEAFMRRHTSRDLTHGMCPDCARRTIAELA
jgi:hypothetical protein